MNETGPIQIEYQEPHLKGSYIPVPATQQITGRATIQECAHTIQHRQIYIRLLSEQVELEGNPRDRSGWPDPATQRDRVGPRGISARPGHRWILPGTPRRGLLPDDRTAVQAVRRP